MTSPTQKSKTWAASENRKMKERNFHPNQAKVLGHTWDWVCFWVSYKLRLCSEAKLQSNAHRCHGKHLQGKNKISRKQVGASRHDGEGTDRAAETSTLKSPSFPAHLSHLHPNSSSGYRWKEKNKCKQKSLDFTLVVTAGKRPANAEAHQLFWFWRTRNGGEKGTPKLTKQQNLTSFAPEEQD